MLIVGWQQHHGETGKVYKKFKQGQGQRERSCYQLDKKITVIGDSFIEELNGVSDSIIVQQFGKISAWDLRHKIRNKEVDLQYPFVILMIGGFQIMTHSVDQIIDGIQAVVLAIRARVHNSWIGVSTLLYRPKDETLSKAKIDAINQRLFQLVQQFVMIGCRCVLVRSHTALVSPVDNKILRPIHVYFTDGLVPNKQAAYLLVRFYVVCALEVFVGSGN